MKLYKVVLTIDNTHFNEKHECFVYAENRVNAIEEAKQYVNTVSDNDPCIFDTISVKEIKMISSRIVYHECTKIFN